ncbi:protein spinster homolog 1-like [Ranitomeya imitator]|uniref:protein spinster homolog 1-like n=1 Tax=Ranitomeya imitator TaxID=111125 RepID=UPI0037E89FB2
MTQGKSIKHMKKEMQKYLCLQGSVNMASLCNSTQKMPIPSVEKVIDIEEQDENGETQDLHERTGVSVTRSFFTVGILTFMYLVITMATFTVAGAMPYLQAAFKIDDSKSGLINLVYTVSNALCGLIYGYLGDRWSRKHIVCTGMAIWSATIIGLSFVPNENFTAFLVINGLVGAAEASFTIIAPSIIADMYVGDRRSRALSCYYGVAFIGSGLGYIDGSKVTSAASGDWRWAFRISPALGMIGVLLMFVFVKEPTRGATEENNSKPPSSKTWISDVKQLLKNWSFVFSTLGMTAVKFAAGAIGFHALTFLKRARDVIQPCQTEVCDSQDSLIFGGAMVIAGICGVVSGVEIAKRYSKYNPRADPIVCASGMLCSAIFLYFAIFMGNISLVATYVCLFLGILCLTLNCSVSAAIRLNVVPPASRSTAEAIFMIVSDLLGAAGSSYIIGLVSNCYIFSHHFKATFTHLFPFVHPRNRVLKLEGTSRVTMSNLLLNAGFTKPSQTRSSV